MLYFSAANAKTKVLGKILGLNRGEKIYSLDLPAGHSCPGAKDCLARVILNSSGKRKIKDGPHTKFRCFSASQEVIYPAVYKRRQQNYAALRQTRKSTATRNLILDSLPRNCKVLRYHVSGDFFKYSYLEGAYLAAMERPDILFYGYTKSLHFLRRLIGKFYLNHNLDKGVLLPNFLLTGSRGGKYDDLLTNLHMRTAEVIFSEKETNLPIDHTDDHAATIGGSFALLIHGVQPAGTPASKAWSIVKRAGGGYSKKK